MLQLVIGNKNYSSWSMRPWVLMRHFGMPFEEIRLRFDFTPGSDYFRALANHTPTGKVPVLLVDGYAVWDTLAIVETLAEAHPEHAVWPREGRARARARSLCAEMHDGFRALRQLAPMNIEAHLPDVGERLVRDDAAIVADLARLDAMWLGQLASSGGPFLFGAFSAADAYYAPVASRVRTYDLPVSAAARAYLDRVWASPGVSAWVADALAEQDFLDFEEPYRRGR